MLAKYMRNKMLLMDAWAITILIAKNCGIYNALNPQPTRNTDKMVRIAYVSNLTAKTDEITITIISQV